MAEEADTPKINFALLNPKEINLELRFMLLCKEFILQRISPWKRILYLTQCIIVYLTKDARIEYFLINDKFVPPVYSTKLVPEHFNPVFPYPEMLNEDSNLNCFSFYLPNYEGKIKFNFTLFLFLFRNG